MSKEKWLRHMEETEGIRRPSKNRPLVYLEEYKAWREAHQRHLAEGCKECHARRKTLEAYDRRKAYDEAMHSCGLTRVRGNLGGVYWE